jgi:hypothetical protein
MSAKLRTVARPKMLQGLAIFQDTTSLQLEACLPIEVLNSGRYGELSHQQIRIAVVAMLLVCNLSAGSAGDIDLYKVLNLYLKDPSTRAEINAVLKGKRLIQDPNPPDVAEG